MARLPSNLGFGVEAWRSLICMFVTQRQRGKRTHWATEVDHTGSVRSGWRVVAYSGSAQEIVKQLLNDFKHAQKYFFPGALRLLGEPVGYAGTGRGAIRKPPSVNQSRRLDVSHLRPDSQDSQTWKRLLYSGAAQCLHPSTLLRTKLRMGRESPRRQINVGA